MFPKDWGRLLQQGREAQLKPGKGHWELRKKQIGAWSYPGLLFDSLSPRPTMSAKSSDDFALD